MKSKVVERYKYAFGILVTIAALIVYKIRFLSLPYYWDEAWPYGVAVRTMQARGISLLPGSISTFIARGHPLLFHALAAGWMDLFGTELIAGHSFTLLVSILMIITIWQFGKAFFSERIGFIAAILFAAQAVFIAQSVFLMPEMLLAFWALLSLFSWYKESYIFFILCTSSLLLTKESGGVLVVALGIAELASFLLSKGKNRLNFLKKASIIAAPVLIAAIFFIIQKVKFGWYLYPFYMDYVKAGWGAAIEKIPEILAYFFIYYGRNGISFFLMIAIVVLIIKKIKLSQRERQILPVLCLFPLLFIVFSSFNYYIPRYLLCAFPFFFIAAATLIDKAFAALQFRSKKVIYFLLVAGFTGTGIFYYLHNRGNDKDYSPSVDVAWRMVGFCERQKIYDSPIFTTCVLSYDLGEPYAGFVAGRPFTHLAGDFTNNTEYCILSSDEIDTPLFDRLKKEHHLIQVKRYEESGSWTELYKVPR